MRPFIDARDDEARRAAEMDSMQKYQENGRSVYPRYLASERGVFRKDSGTKDERRRSGKRNVVARSNEQDEPAHQRDGWEFSIPASRSSLRVVCSPRRRR